MALTTDELNQLHQNIKRHWLDAQTTICAYQRGFNHSKRLSDFRKYGTLVAAALTALSQVAPKAVAQFGPDVTAYSSGSGVLTAILAVLTALLAGIDTVVAPQRTLKEFWDGQKGLEAIQVQLITVLYSLKSARDMSVGMQTINRVYEELQKARTLPVRLKEEDETRANKLFDRSPIADYMARMRPGSDMPQVSGEGALGIFPVQRRAA